MINTEEGQVIIEEGTFNKEKELIAIYKTLDEAVKAAKISKGIIIQELNKEIKTLSGGFYWSYEKTLNKTKERYQIKFNIFLLKSK